MLVEKQKNALVLENVTVAYNDKVALENVTFNLGHPSILTIMGPNGAGKTTLLKAILGLVKVRYGKITVFEHDVFKDPEKVRKLIGYVPQREHISTNMPIRVKDVVLMARLSRKGVMAFPSRKDIEAAKNALKIVGLENLWNQRFSTLSGGQQQRVMVARALAVEPKMLLLDEPFSATDIPSQKAIINLLYNLRKKENITILIVTHNVNPLLNCSDKILLLNRRVVGFGSPRDVIKEDLLEELYGAKVTLLKTENVCYLVESDIHV
ncbi:MAG: metal ABC transporter ATP-binding protein [Candidatus Asgardarchaeia archaeon]